MSTRTLSFTGRVGGVTYDDPGLFEEAAHALGYREHGSDRAHRWALGTPVAIEVDGVKVAGQVWSKAPTRGQHWVALDDGTYALMRLTGSVAGVYDATGHSINRNARLAS